MDLDGVDVLDQPRQDRRLVARAGADLVDPIGRLGFKHFGHEGDVVRGSDRLALADRDRFVVVRLPLGTWEGGSGGGARSGTRRARAGS